jgi:hypothetical protein
MLSVQKNLYVLWQWGYLFKLLVYMGKGKKNNTF